MPLEPAALAVCSATLLCLPLACVASPIVGLIVWAQTCRTLHSAAHGDEQVRAFVKSTCPFYYLLLEQACSPLVHCACTTAHVPLRMNCVCMHCMGATRASMHSPRCTAQTPLRKRCRPSPSWANPIHNPNPNTPTHTLQALTELGAGTTTRRINGGALWNVASLVNVLTALSLFLLPAVDQYYVSHQHWLLPFCLLCTKLLLAQSFKFLAASAGLTSSGWQLLTSLEEMQASRPGGK